MSAQIGNFNHVEQMEIGDWCLDKIVGTGAFGSVLKFRNKFSGECIAVKKCRPDIKKSEILELWGKEVELFINLKHPGLVQTLDLPSDLRVLAKDSPVLCMEFCNAGDLRKLLNQPTNCCGLAEREIFAVAADISSALCYLHSCKVVHRDLKPENIVIHHQNEKKIYKLIDFGFAKDLKLTSSCQTFVGTMEYLAPELFIRNSYTSAVDYWSFGFIIHECITGVRPFISGSQNWLPYAERKTKDQICIYFRADGTEVYSTKLMKENNLNSLHQVMFEEWFRSALDWNPDTRGRDGDNITIFDKLQHILTNKVLTIFWVEGLKQLHYSADDSITMSTIHDWIERDTGIPQTLQLLINSNGHRADPEKSSMQLYSLSDDFTVYLLQKKSVVSCLELPDVPELVSSMFHDPRQKTEFVIQRRMWAQACFFLRQQENLFKKLSQGLKLFLGYATVQLSRLTSMVQQLSGELRRLDLWLQYFTHSLKVDQLKYEEQSRRGGLPTNAMLEQWTQAHALLVNQLRIVESQGVELEQHVANQVPKFNEISRTCREVLAQRFDLLSTFVQSAHELYLGLLRKPKEERQEPANNIPMSKILVKALKDREQHFTSYYSQHRNVANCVALFDTLLETFGRVQAEVLELEQKILLFQEQRQADIWAFLERAVSLWQQTSQLTSRMSSLSMSPTVENALPALAEMNEVIERSLLETSSVVQENQSLRYEMQGALTRSLTTYCSMTKNAADWNFLHTD